MYASPSTIKQSFARGYSLLLYFFHRYPDSRLAKLFSGEIPIILDTMKQHYFIDRDGPSFRHILHFLRNGQLVLPEDYNELDILLQEAVYYELNELVDAIRECSRSRKMSVPKECLAVSISPDMGERISLSGRKRTIENCFPVLKSALTDQRNSGWSREGEFVIRFPVNGFCQLNSIEVLETIMKNDFSILTSNGGGVEGQQFSDFLFTRPSK